MMRIRFAAGAAAALVVVGIFAAPLLPGLYLVFAAVCHQIPSRCFEWLGRPLSVCARCLGLYTGVLGAALCPVRRHAGVALAVLAAANGLDWLLDITGNDARFALGLALGWLAASCGYALASRKRAAAN
jgi:uncharacterized membrane protein